MSNSDQLHKQPHKNNTSGSCNPSLSQRPSREGSREEWKQQYRDSRCGPVSFSKHHLLHLRKLSNCLPSLLSAGFRSPVASDSRFTSIQARCRRRRPALHSDEKLYSQQHQLDCTLYGCRSLYRSSTSVHPVRRTFCKRFGGGIVRLPPRVFCWERHGPSLPS